VAAPETPPSDNGLSRLVKTPGISIKDSLKGAGPEPVIPGVLAAEETPVREDGEAESPKIEADPDSIIRAWNEYATSIQKSKPRIYSTLIHHKPVVKGDGVVMVLLNSEAQRDNFTKNIKSALLKYIKQKTGITSLELITEVSESEENGKKIYTEQDKLEFLLNKNPELAKLKSRFNLDFDD
jgi:DNA polymerase-3 subunit gamma/tau